MPSDLRGAVPIPAKKNSHSGHKVTERNLNKQALISHLTYMSWYFIIQPYIPITTYFFIQTNKTRTRPSLRGYKTPLQKLLTQSAWPSTHEIHFFWHFWETESHSKCPVPLYLTLFPAPLPQWSLSLRNRNCAVDVSAGAGITGSLVLCIRNVRATCMKSHQHGCLNETQTRTAPMDMLTWKRRTREASTNELGATGEHQKQEKLSSPEESPQTAYLIPNDQFWDHMHKSNSIWMEQVVLLCLCI
jgi:hypothetical protein